MFGKLNEDEIRSLLKKQLIGHLGCHMDGITYVVPLSYAYEDDCIYAISKEGMKMNILRKNPKVCFQVENTHDLSDWQSVISWGDFEELKEGEGRTRALDILHKRKLPILSSETMRLSALWPFDNVDDEMIPGVVFRIRLVEKSGRFEKSSENGYVL